MIADPRYVTKSAILNLQSLPIEVVAQFENFA